ncbi:ABC transporter permease [Phaeovulum vinaykumarii]|uniref:Putative ABC transport system permease protein n=1 Tax=Phaeovulum vinaykumarii TaxID=407234 RepID=A0A1N7K1I1_9RHOB|nr:FtsX-like permease family protein [Phaeovulum vinaykumarii]SIS55450.1 putative ABC transport system permease protein [Phaeovulum vinaykumarii]SOB92380.1 putative ABC transport system permease protein [Phaeovulum vinaykumarii]
MSALALRLAARELRGGLAGFRVFLLCLILGVGAIVAVGQVRAALQDGLAREGRVILGGDAELEFTYRHADAQERAWMEDRAAAVSQVTAFRSMARLPSGDAALARVKAVDAAWPLVGEAQFDPPMTVEAALSARDGVPGAAMERVLAERLELAPGDRFLLGDTEFEFRAVLLREPDSAGVGGFGSGFGPRLLVREAALAEAGLIGPGALYEVAYRLLLPGADLAAEKSAAETRFHDAGMRWRDARRASPGSERFLDRMATFLVLVGLAGLGVGGVGISAAVRAWMERKTATIAILRSLGASAGLVRAVFGLQIAAMTALGVTLGLALGAGLPLLAAPLLAPVLPFDLDFALDPRALAEGAVYGALVAALFALWPLARRLGVPAAALLRDIGPGARAWPGAGSVIAAGGLLGALAGAAAFFSARPMLALGTVAGVGVALALLWAVGAGLAVLARRAARGGLADGRPVLRTALAAVGGPRSEARAVVMALGLGLTVLAAIGQIDGGLRRAVATDLPARAPAYFVLDIQPDQLAPFSERLAGDPLVEKVQTAPMLRGVVTRLKGRPAREVAGDHWVVRGDRGVSYAAAPPPDTRIVAGEWWPEDYTGPAQASFAAAQAEELGLALGDTLSVNILGREIEATITSLREVDFSSAGLGFVLILNEAALRGAPHSAIATIYAPPEAEAGLLRDLTRAFPNITLIGVREAIGQVARALGQVAQASSLAAGVTLASGLVVLIGAAAAGEAQRAREAALLKVLGASRRTILASFALRAALMGAAAGVVAVALGLLAGWVVIDRLMEAEFRPALGPALWVVAGGAGANLAAGLVFALRPLAARPAGVLRAP